MNYKATTTTTRLLILYQPLRLSHVYFHLFGIIAGAAAAGGAGIMITDVLSLHIAFTISTSDIYEKK